MIFHELKTIKEILWDAHIKIDQRLETLEKSIAQHNREQIITPEREDITKMLTELHNTFTSYDRQLRRFTVIEEKIHELLN